MKFTKGGLLFTPLHSSSVSNAGSARRLLRSLPLPLRKIRRRSCPHFQNRKRRPPRKVPEGVPPARKTRLDCCRRRDLRPPRGIPPDPLDSCIISVTKSRVTGTRSGAFCLLVLAYFEILQSEPFLLGSHVPDVFPHLFSAFLQIL